MRSVSIDAGRQRGVALILALLVVALATVVAVAIAVRAETELRRSETMLHGQQAMQYIYGAEHWVAQILLRDRQDGPTDHFGQAWAVGLPPLPVEGGTVIGRLQDLNGRFNLTNLVNEDGSVSEPHARQFQRLLEALGVGDQLAVAAVIDFIDPGTEPTPPDGAEDAYYLGADPPHRTPNRPLTTLSELVLLRDFDPALLPVLAPHVVTLPRRTPLNVNTATAPVLMSLVEGLSEPVADGLVESSLTSGYDSLEEFRLLLGMQPEPGVELALASDWFVLQVEAGIGTTALTMYSLLERAPEGRTRVLARQRTAW